MSRAGFFAVQKSMENPHAPFFAPMGQPKMLRESFLRAMLATFCGAPKRRKADTGMPY